MRATDLVGGEVRIDVSGATLSGNLHVPDGATGLVLFAHGSGSGRHSPRNRFVAQRLRSKGVGTLLFDLLTVDEEKEDLVDAHLRFDIPLLASRLQETTHWTRRQEHLADLKVGYLGSSTGAGAALLAAASAQDEVSAVVGRGGRPDLAGEGLAEVRCPVLFIVGGEDHHVLRLNRQAAGQLTSHVEIDIIPGATHLFEEPGTLEQAADSAAAFFGRHL